MIGFLRRARRPCPFDVVVPTRNSAGRLPALLRHYRRRLGIEPLFLLDATSTDATEQMLLRAKARFHATVPPAPRVEAMLPAIVGMVPPDRWVLRVDDDELPSRRLIDWLADFLPGFPLDTVAVHRRFARVTGKGKLKWAVCWRMMDGAGEWGKDRQWRVYRPGRACHVDILHSPGIEVGRWASSPEDAYLVHFDWVLRSRAEREAKVMAYERQEAGKGVKHLPYYVPEDVPPGEIAYHPFETREFDRFVEEATRGIR